jgi:hypothetical protein
MAAVYGSAWLISGLRVRPCLMAASSLAFLDRDGSPEIRVMVDTVRRCIRDGRHHIIVVDPPFSFPVRCAFSCLLPFPHDFRVAGTF